MKHDCLRWSPNHPQPVHCTILSVSVIIIISQRSKQNMSSYAEALRFCFEVFGDCKSMMSWRNDLACCRNTKPSFQRFWKAKTARASFYGVSSASDQPADVTVTRLPRNISKFFFHRILLPQSVIIDGFWTCEIFHGMIPLLRLDTVIGFDLWTFT